MTVQHRTRRPDRERGFAAVEVIFGAILVSLVLALALQFFSAVYASQAAGRAAWDAARAQSLGQSPASAASASLPGNVSLVRVTSLGDGVEIVVRAPEPLRVPVLALPEIKRRAYVP
jgi:Tfp pilus assembly protein FimT